MTTTTGVQQLLDRATAILPDSDEDLVYKGVAASVAERMMVLRKAATRLQDKYGSLEELEETIKDKGIPPTDHTRYTDLLEWRAIRHEISQLQHMFETL